MLAVAGMKLLFLIAVHMLLCFRYDYIVSAQEVGRAHKQADDRN